jgi:hypothetical protein
VCVCRAGPLMPLSGMTGMQNLLLSNNQLTGVSSLLICIAALNAVVCRPRIFCGDDVVLSGVLRLVCLVIAAFRVAIRRPG